MSLGPDLQYDYDGARLGKPDPVLRVEDLRKSFGGLVATDDVSLEVERGSITGMIGPNGAGKSTLFNLISGYYAEDAGRVLLRPEVEDGEDADDADEADSRTGDVDDDPARHADADPFDDDNVIDVTDMSPHEIARSGLVRTFQTPRRLEGMTVREAMLVGPQGQAGESILPLFLSGDRVADREARNLERAHEMLERFEIDHLAEAPATELSGGQLKLVEMARALMSDPEILLLDEPVAGVNPTLAKKLAGFVRELNEEGQTVLVIEHDMSFIMELADPIVVLDQGRVLMEADPRTVRTDDRVIEAYLGGGA